MNLMRTVVLGAGGHAAVLIDHLQSQSNVEIAGILEITPALWGKHVLNVPVLGSDDLLPGLKQQGIEYFVVGVGSVRSTDGREKLYSLGLEAGMIPLNIIHPTAFLSKTVQFGNGIQFLPGCILNTNAVIGNNVLVNCGAIVEHDCMIGDHTHIATGAKLAGGVHIEDHVHVGIGAVIRQGIDVGAGATIGSGAVVVKNVLPGQTVVGVPARDIEKK